MARPPRTVGRGSHHRQLTAGLVGLVALSAVLSAFYSGATIVEMGLLGIAGAVVGGALVIALGAWP